MEKAIVLLSGGLDSTTCAKMAAIEHGPGNVIALSLNYGQKHAVEQLAAEKVFEELKLLKFINKTLPSIFAGAGSTLVDADKPNPEVTYEELRKDFGVSPTYVPFRNGNLLSAAAAIALVEGASFIYYGAHAEDSRNWAYPDCTPEFNGAMANAIYVGTYHKVRLKTPLQWMMKGDVVTLGTMIGAPLHLSHSCYNGKQPACGKCPTCVERIAAFKNVGLMDPIPYEIEIDWAGCQPWVYTK